jgi:hypothetical protein
VVARGAFLALLLVAGAAGARVAPEAGVSFAGGETALLRGFTVDRSTTAHLAFVNLGPSGNRCSLELETVAGERLAPAIELTLLPFEERPFLDVFGASSDAFAGAEAQAKVSCAGPFSTFLVLSDAAGAAMETIAPEKLSIPLGEQSLTVTEAEVACSTGAACFDAPGTVHVPAAPPEAAVGRVTFPAPGGTVTRLKLSLDVTVGDWYPDEPSGKHLIYWFVIDRNFDMPGMLYFRGPGKNEAFARHGIHLTHPQKIKVIKKFQAEVGRTYHVENDYDMAGKRFRVTITDVESGQVMAVLQSRPNKASFTIKAGQDFLVDMGFPPDGEPTEVPSYGWKYSNVHVEAFLRR